MADPNGVQPPSLGLPSGYMAGLARSLTASHRVQTALQDASKSPKTPVGAKSADNTPRTSPTGMRKPPARSTLVACKRTWRLMFMCLLPIWHAKAAHAHAPVLDFMNCLSITRSDLVGL